MYKLLIELKHVGRSIKIYQRDVINPTLKLNKASSFPFGITPVGKCRKILTHKFLSVHPRTCCCKDSIRLLYEENEIYISPNMTS